VGRVEHRFVHANGLRLHLLDFGGDGPETLLLHGVGGGAWVWHAVAPQLAGTRRVLALDLRGYGESQWSQGGRYATDDHVTDVEAVIATLDLDEIDLIGFSWGGLIGLGLAARSPRVNRLGMVDIGPSSPLSETEVMPLPYRSADMEEAIEGERSLAPRAHARTLEAAAALLTAPAAEGGFVRKLDPFFLTRWPFRADDRWDELRALDRELLIVHAEESRVLPGEVAQRMRDEARRATLVEIAGSGHLVPIEQPDALVAALDRFLS
jgi:pimeloyl-ACP methyl ester carboxylesterase